MVTFMIILKIFCIIVGLLLSIWHIIEAIDSFKRGWADCAFMALIVVVCGLFLASIGILAIN